MKPQIQRDAATGEPVAWRFPTLLAFRFIFIYFVLYMVPGPLGSLPARIKPDDFYRQMWHQVVPWVGVHILHLAGTSNFAETPNGSGDQLYDYILLLCFFTLAIVLSAVWSVLDRKRKNYEQLYQWLRLFMRLSLATAMISYGANKLFQMQFPTPPLARWVDTYGQSAPMGMLWTFMGFSRPYSFFAGAAEMLGGLLLVVPQLTTLGSLISLTVLSNVLFLNLFYDVPRKIYSIHLVLICLFLLIPDVKRLLNLFILNRTAEPAPEVPMLKDRQLNRIVFWGQIAFGVITFASCMQLAHSLAVRAETHLPPSIRGIWSVEEFVMDGALRQPMLTDSDRWQRVVFDDDDALIFESMDGELKAYGMQLDLDKRTVGLTDPELEGGDWTSQLTFEQPQPDRVTMKGYFGGHRIEANLHRMDMSDPKKFLLLNRGFHWISQKVVKR